VRCRALLTPIPSDCGRVTGYPEVIWLCPKSRHLVKFRDLSGTNAVMVPAGQQGRPCGRTHGRSVEAVVRDPFVDDTVHCLGLNLATEGGRQAGTFA
jgi:hypothetical protein